MYRILLPILLLLSLAGCASSPDAKRPAGHLSLQVPVTIPPGAATLRLQYGRITAFNAVQEYDPFCVFELDTVSDGPQEVAPARFDIQSVRRSVETFAGLPAPFPHFRFVRTASLDDDRPSHIYYKTLFRLAPNPQKARALTCMSDQMAGVGVFMRHLTLKEMRGALGSLFSLEPDGAR